MIQATLQQQKIKGSFFLTGNFYANPAYASLIRKLKETGHYLGAHSDKHLLYADWTNRDSLLVSQEQFIQDLQANYSRMATFDVEQKHAVYFIPPFEWYNATITQWTKEAGYKLVNFTPGTRSTADYTYPEMGKRYVSSDQIYRSILACEATDTHRLNGFILLMHVGTDPRRTDKFYFQLDRLVTELKSKGYKFVRINELLE